MTANPAPAPAPPPSPTLPPPPVLPARTALFLDVDGVLAPIAPTPDAVAPDPRRTRVLKRLLLSLQGRLAVVSGRTLGEIDRICDGAVACAAGVHGLERRGADGKVRREVAHPGLSAAHEALTDFAQAHPGALVEDKGLGVTLHYRLAPGAARQAQNLAGLLARTYGLTLQPGDMVQELKTPGADKGGALSAFMGEGPFSGAVPVMVGDDLTDESAFTAAARMGGFGILVGPPRDTAARYALGDHAAVMDWLETLTEAA